MSSIRIDTVSSTTYLDNRPRDSYRYSGDEAPRKQHCACTQPPTDIVTSQPEVSLLETAANPSGVLKERVGDWRRRSVLFSHRGPATCEINISGVHVLLALALAFCLTSVLAWVFVTYWLFAP